MTNEHSTGDPFHEPDSSTVHDWHGQGVERDTAAAEEAVARAGGDDVEAERIFDETRPEHLAHRFDVDPSRREQNKPSR